jgi:hypothetical protein
MKNKKGVTLVALVITIIILLILAGVTISIVSGDNGVLTKATKVELEYSKTEVRELLLMQVNTKLLKASSKIEGTSTDISTEFNETSVIDYLMNGDSEDADSPGVKCLLEDESVEKVKTVKEDSEIYTVYIIDPTKLSDSINSYGVGRDFNDKKDVFTLEVVTEEVTAEDNSTYKRSTGEFELKYYDSEGNPSTLETMSLYLTNQS